MIREEWPRSRQGKKVAKAVAGQDREPAIAGSAFGQTSHIADADGRGLCRNRNEDRRFRRRHYTRKSATVRSRAPSPPRSGNGSPPIPKARTAAPLSRTGFETVMHREISDRSARATCQTDPPVETTLRLWRAIWGSGQQLPIRLSSQTESATDRAGRTGGGSLIGKFWCGAAYLIVDPAADSRRPSRSGRSFFKEP